MAHELEMNENGEASMMYAGKTPWHGLGTRVDTEVTAGAAIKLAGLDWELEKQPIYIKGQADIDGIPVVGTEIPNKHAVVRLKDNKVLGVVGDHYNIIQNADCFDFLDELVGEGQALYHTAGSLFGGSRIFITMKLPGECKVGDDHIDKYVFMATSHDGSLALTGRITPTRVVCANTMAVALANKTSQSFSIRHTKNYKDSIIEARRILNLSILYYENMEKEFNRMLDCSFKEADMDLFLKKLLPASKKSLDSDILTATTITKNTREMIMDKFHNGIGIDPIKNTKWAAFNAVTEYVTHNKTSTVHGDRDRDHVKLTSTLYGSGSRLSQNAYDLLSV